MKLAILGGSFNPLHIGHAMLADTVCSDLGYDKVLFVPTYIPPHKMINSTVSADERFAMVKFFCDSEKTGRFEAEPCEIERKGTSYTVDTLIYLTEKYKSQLEGKIGLIMGQESAAEFYKWKDSEKILQMADIIIARRFQGDFQSDSKFTNTAAGSFQGDFKVVFDSEKAGFDFIMLDNPAFPVSSTEIRTRIGEGKAWKYMVPQAVYDFLETECLYKYKG